MFLFSSFLQFLFTSFGFGLRRRRSSFTLHFEHECFGAHITQGNIMNKMNAKTQNTTFNSFFIFRFFRLMRLHQIIIMRLYIETLNQLIPNPFSFQVKQKTRKKCLKKRKQKTNIFIHLDQMRWEFLESCASFLTNEKLCLFFINIAKKKKKLKFCIFLCLWNQTTGIFFSFLCYYCDQYLRMVDVVNDRPLNNK